MREAGAVFDCDYEQFEAMTIVNCVLVVPMQFLLPTIEPFDCPDRLCRVVQLHVVREAMTVGQNECERRIGKQCLIASNDPQTILGMEVDNFDPEAIGCDQRVHQKISKASCVMMYPDRDLLQKTFRRRRCVMATQYPIRIKGEFVIQRATPLLCCCVSPAADLAGVGKLP